MRMNRLRTGITGTTLPSRHDVCTTGGNTVVRGSWDTGNCERLSFINKKG